MKILLLGLPGAGKGTQGKRLANRLHIPHLSLGDFVRDQAEKRTDLGREIEANWGKTWQPLADELAVKAASQLVSGVDGWILDGFPRNVVQAQHASFLGWINYAILLSISEETSLARVLGRGRQHDEVEKWIRRIAAERERLQPLVEYLRSQIRLIEVDADRSEEKVLASLWREFRRKTFSPLRKEGR